MTSLDWIIVAFCLGLALHGYAQGFIVGALTLVGFAGGAVLGGRLGPTLVGDDASSPYAPLFALCGALLVGGLLALGLEAVGLKLRGRVRAPGLGAIDGVLGAVLVAGVGLGIAWVAGAVALQTPGARALRDEIQRSAVLRRLNGLLPPSGPVLNALARFDPLPEVSGPRVRLPAPRGAIARDPQVRAASGSVVRILGSACGLGVEGSGWVAGPGLVVTNAHVVAGQEDTVVLVRGRGERLPAQALAFDPRNDIAVLRVPALRQPALPLARTARPGTPAAVLGFPENGPYDVRPGRVGATQAVLSQDAYGDGPVRRQITSLRALVRSGNSGGPMVDGAGRVVTTIFAATTGSGARAGYGVPNAVVRGALARAGEPVGTGPCTR